MISLQTEGVTEQTMKLKRTFKRLFIVLFLLQWMLIPLGCSPSYDPGAGYKESSINEEIPVPRDAQQLEVETNTNNPNIKKGVKYELKNIGGPQGLYPPESYLSTLEEWGWTELKEERLGHVLFFEKEDNVIAVEIHENTLAIYEMHTAARERP